MESWVTHYIARSPNPEDWPSPNGKLYQYILAGNGLFVRAARREMEVVVEWQSFEVRGLPPVQPTLTLQGPLVPADLLLEMLDTARLTPNQNECLFFLFLDGGKWELHMPRQIATPQGVSMETDRTPLVDLHSHVNYAARFSPDDDRDHQWFHLHAVLGSIFSAPEIRVRVGIYGHLVDIPANWVFEVPSEIRDALGDQPAAVRVDWEGLDTGIPFLEEPEPVRLAPPMIPTRRWGLPDLHRWFRRSV
jgi:hypothetical protein